MLEALGEVERYPDLIVADLRLVAKARAGSPRSRACATSSARAVPALVVSGDLSPRAEREVREAGLLLLPKPVVPASLEVAASALVGAAGPLK